MWVESLDLANRLDYKYDIPRTGILLPDIPFTWNTNMPDVDLLDLYFVIRDDPDIAGRIAKVEAQGLMSISLRVFSKFVDFKDGACHCIGVNDTIYAIYKTTSEWNVWAAHQQEMKELRDDLERERQVERMLVWAEIHYLVVKCAENINVRNYDEAFRFLCGRVDLMRKNGIWWDRAEENMRLSSFPIDFCVRYLNQYAHSGEQYVDLAGAIAFWKRTISVDDAERLFQAAIAKCPEDGRLYKNICLFWERRQDFHHALQYCKLALSRHLADDTKGGFATRIKRLQKKAELNAVPLPSTP